MGDVKNDSPDLIEPTQRKPHDGGCDPGAGAGGGGVGRRDDSGARRQINPVRALGGVRISQVGDDCTAETHNERGAGTGLAIFHSNAASLIVQPK